MEDPLEYEDMVHIVLAPQNVDVNAYQELLATGQVQTFAQSPLLRRFQDY